MRHSESFGGKFSNAPLLLQTDQIRLIVDVVHVVYSHANVAAKEMNEHICR